MERVKAVGGLRAEEDKAAQVEAEAEDVPDIGLLRARLAYDGGYYQSALLALSLRGIDGMSREQLLERSYRMARIFQAMGMESAATNGFRSVVQTGHFSKSHYPANSALQVAIHFEHEGMLDSSEYYYRLCLSMPDHPYRNSIDRSAREGIRRLE
ncbi:MAG: hypothetical protein ACKO7B_08985, partial [Flavobacteriales bacterium]